MTQAAGLMLIVALGQPPAGSLAPGFAGERVGERGAATSVDLPVNPMPDQAPLTPALSHAKPGAREPERSVGLMVAPTLDQVPLTPTLSPAKPGAREHVIASQTELPPPRPLPKLPAPTGPAVALEEVLTSVEAHFPLLLAIAQEREIAAGQAQTAQGAFDTNFFLRDFYRPDYNTYPSNRAEVSVGQYAGGGTGVSYYAGYRISNGIFPEYYGYNRTASGGELRGGVAVPLARDRAIDRRRATLQQAIIGRQIAEPVIRRQRLDAQRGASRAYWAWVATGQRVHVAKQLLETASSRDAGLGVRVQQGALAAIERVDNQRTIADRAGRLVIAERRFQQAQYDLSLYFRDANGCGVVAGLDRVPADLPDLLRFDPAKHCEAVQVALDARPELQRLRLLRERTLVELRYAENQTLPGVNAAVNAAHDIGTLDKKAAGGSIDRQTAELVLGIDLPIQRNDARGRVRTAQAQAAQYTAQERFQADQITAEVRDLLSALERAYALREQARRQFELAFEVQQGEERKLLIGNSTLLSVNLRELATFDALLTEIDALFEYFRALADYRAALGLDTFAVPAQTPAVPPGP